MTKLRFELLGGFRVSDAAGREIDIPGNKPALLLAFLALNPGLAYSRDRLVGLLWRDRGETQGRGSLRQALWVLRQSLRNIEPIPLVADGETIALDPANVETDLWTFESLVAKGTAEALTAGIELYKGELLDELRMRDAAIEEYFRDQRERIHGLAVEACTSLLKLQTRNGPEDEAAATAKHMLILDPLQEAAHRTLMAYYASHGQIGLALKQYQSCQSVLEKELHIAPQSETTVLFEKIRNDNAGFSDRVLNDWSDTQAVEEDVSRATDQQKPSIAVLPFVNLSGDTEQEYFSDGITEDIITALSKLRWFLVIARNSTFVYKNITVEIKSIGQELGVQYVLEGSVRKSGNRVRVSAQLVDVVSSAHIWAHTYDRELTDIFALQDDITQSVTAAIEPKLVAAEGIRSQRRSPDDLGAWDRVMRALTHYWRMTTQDSETAIDLLHDAVQRYPDYGPAHSLLAFALLVSGHVGWIPESEDYEYAAELAHRAIELDDEDPWAHLALGYLAFTERQTSESVREYKRALELNPNFSTAYGYLGWALVFDGQSEHAIGYFQQALRMSPYDPLKAFFYSGTGVAHYYAHRYDKAIEWARRAIGERPGFTAAHRILCASLAQAGRIAETQAAMVRLREIQPNVSIAWIEQHVPYTEQAMPHFLDGMRRAGLN